MNNAEKIEQLVEKYPDVVLLDGTKVGSINCMPEFAGEFEDVAEFEFFPAHNGNQPVIVVWEIAEPDFDDYDTSPSGAWY